VDDALPLIESTTLAGSIRTSALSCYCHIPISSSAFPIIVIVQGYANYVVFQIHAPVSLLSINSPLGKAIVNVLDACFCCRISRH
jgi:hypothetical protein